MSGDEDYLDQIKGKIHTNNFLTSLSKDFAESVSHVKYLKNPLWEAIMEENKFALDKWYKEESIKIDRRKAEAAEKDRLEQERLMKLDRNARFSGLNSIYHEAPTTWVDYSKITKNNDLLLRKSIEAKKQANNWLNEQSQRRKTQTAAP